MQLGPTGVEGAGGICRGAGGRWRGLAGLRDDAPSEARGADGSRAGRTRGGRRSGGVQATKPRNLKRSRGPVAEDGGFEPPRACTQHAFQACAIGH